MGFIRAQRLTVAITRAKHLLLMIGNKRTLLNDQLCKGLVQSVPIARQYNYSDDLEWTAMVSSLQAPHEPPLVTFRVLNFFFLVIERSK